jgi:hypothetical protein
MPNPNRLTRGSAPNRAREASQRPGSFARGHMKMGGRRPGSPNVMTRELKVAIITAAQRLGSDLKGTDGVVGYLTRIAKDDIKTFTMLLRAVLPLQIKSKTNENWRDLKADGTPYLTADGQPRYPTYKEIFEEKLAWARQTGVPVGFIELEEVQRLRSEGMSASEAMRCCGLNSKLEHLPGWPAPDRLLPKDAISDVFK